MHSVSSKARCTSSGHVMERSGTLLPVRAEPDLIPAGSPTTVDAGACAAAQRRAAICIVHSSRGWRARLLPAAATRSPGQQVSGTVAVAAVPVGAPIPPAPRVHGAGVWRDSTRRVIGPSVPARGRTVHGTARHPALVPPTSLGRRRVGATVASRVRLSPISLPLVRPSTSKLSAVTVAISDRTSVPPRPWPRARAGASPPWRWHARAARRARRQ